MIAEHELAVLTKDLPNEGLVAGDVGTIVHAYGDGRAYEVEFLSWDGHTVAVTTVEALALRKVTGADRSHVRVATPVR